MSEGLADHSGPDLGEARLQFSDDGIPAVVEMVENEMVLDHRTLVEFLSRAGCSYTATIQGDDSIQPGTLLQISPNTILAVAAVGSGPTEEEMIEAASSIILPSEDEGVLQETDEAEPPAESGAAVEAADQQAIQGPALSEGIHIAQENMSEVDFSSFLCENEEGSTSAVASTVEQQDQQQEVDTERGQLCLEHRQVKQECEAHAEGVVDVADCQVTDVIQRALLADVEEEENGGSDSTQDQDVHGEGQPDLAEQVAGGEGNGQYGTDRPATDEMLQEQDQPAQEEQQNVVVIDVTNPIQLSQNSLIVVNGQKCVLQQDPGTGQVVAYPVKEPEKPKRRRGRPRKVPPQENLEAGTSEPLATSQPPPEEKSEEEEEDGLHKLGNGMVEVVTEDGALVRRSCRKRKKVKNMKDFETNLKLNDESDDAPEEEEELDEEAELDDMPRKRGRGRPPRRGGHQGPDLFNPFARNQGGVRRKRGRPRRSSQQRPPMQAFLVQMADGQTLMMQIPTASLPAGVDLRDVAQNIAGSLNAAAATATAIPESASAIATSDSPALATTSTEGAGSNNQQETETSVPGNVSQTLSVMYSILTFVVIPMPTNELLQST